MKLLDLFERGSHDIGDEDADIEIASPRARHALQTARTRYSYAKNDLEAFIKWQQDEADSLEHDIEREHELNIEQQKEINSNEAGVEKIAQLEKKVETLLQQYPKLAARLSKAGIAETTKQK